MTNVDTVLDQVDWELLSQQKLALMLAACTGASPNSAWAGLLNFINALQDAAEQDGRPVVWLHSADEED